MSVQDDKGPNTRSRADSYSRAQKISLEEMKAMSDRIDQAESPDEGVDQTDATLSPGFSP